MKIGIVCSGNFKSNRFDIYQSSIHDQVVELRKFKHEVLIFLIKGKGIIGYLRNRKKLKFFLNKNNFDVIHAHSGMSALLVSISTNKKFAVTFHGSDINVLKERFFSFLPALRSHVNFFVSEKLKNKVFFHNFIKCEVLSCGVNLKYFYPLDKKISRKKLNIDLKSKVILFSSSFENKIKNPTLAHKIIELLNHDVLFLEIKDNERREVNNLINSSDVLLMTSHSEGSPLIIKEALACNKPIISVDVGDVKNRIKNVENCFIVEKNAEKIAKLLNNFFDLKKYNSNGRKYIKKTSVSNQVKLLINYYKFYFINN